MQVILDHIEPITRTVRTFWFKPEKPIRYTAGQYIEMFLPHKNADVRGQKHWFTLSSSPTEQLLAVTTKFPTGQESTIKQTLEQLRPGDAAQFSEAMGDFVLPKDTTIPLIFIAGGIGVSPMRSMTKWLLDTQEQRSIDVLYATNSLDELAFTDIFTDYGTKLQIIPSNPGPNWKGESGHLSGAKILELSPDTGSSLYYISGPEPMVETLVDQLQGLGLPESRLVTDYFPGYEPI